MAFLALRVYAFLCYAIFDAAEAGTGVVALFASFLAICASVLDLPAFSARRLSSYHAGGEGVHVHGGHAGVGDGVHGHGGLYGVGWRL